MLLISFCKEVISDFEILFFFLAIFSKLEIKEVVIELKN